MRRNRIVPGASVASGVAGMVAAILAALPGVGCAGASSRPGADGAAPQEIELVFEPTLNLANQTVIFPPVLDQPSPRTVSESVPGDVILAYTRVGCWVEPEAWIGQAGVVDVAVRPTPPVRLTSVTVGQSGGVGVSSSLQGLAETTCVTVRTPGGTWQPFLAPAEITIDGDSVRARFEVASALTDAIAVFLPTYTNISRISYRADAVP